MSITMSLTPEVEERLRAKAAASNETLEEYIQWIAEQFAANPSPASPLTPEERVAEWKAWAASHLALPHPADDDRESIYAGRGE
ncbi:MAG TPA: hypothetical protein VMS17_12065 [Gemmataceae bacterium]|nr:hypothetical protein [Gemmataceae bacterium]